MTSRHTLSLAARSVVGLAVAGAFAALLLLALPVLAHDAGAGDVKAGDLTIHDPHARATPAGAPVAGGYMTLRNEGTEPDRLVGGTAAFAGKVEIHEMRTDDEGIMRMRPLADGLEIPAGGEVVLEPGGYHVMFMQLSEQLKAGETRAVTLEFSRAGEVAVEFAVREVGARHGQGHDHGNGHSGH